MRSIVLDANAVIMHGRSFPTQARTAARQGERIILPDAVKQELVDDVSADKATTSGLDPEAEADNQLI